MVEILCLMPDNTERSVRLPQVPSKGDFVKIDDKFYEVLGRAWDKDQLMLKLGYDHS